MTLALAIIATDSIVVAADSRGTIGDPRGLTAVNDTQQKLFKFGNCGLAISGAAEVALAVLDELNKRNLANPSDIDTALKSFEEAALLYDTWYQGIPPEKRPGTLFILAGYRPGQEQEEPKPLVFLLTSSTRFAPQLANHYPMMAGVPQYAVYLSHRYYSPQISGKNALALAEYLISETASQDPKVGGPINIAIVTPEEFRKLDEQEIDKIQKQNQDLNERLKTFFSQEGGEE